MIRCLPIRLASSAWPRALLILWAPVWARSSRLRKMRGAAGLLGEAFGLVERRRAADVVGGQLVDLGLEVGILPRLGVGGVELVERRHQGFRRVLAAEPAEAAVGIGHGGSDIERRLGDGRDGRYLGQGAGSSATNDRPEKLSGSEPSGIYA